MLLYEKNEKIIAYRNIILKQAFTRNKEKVSVENFTDNSCIFIFTRF